MNHRGFSPSCVFDTGNRTNMDRLRKGRLRSIHRAVRRLSTRQAVALDELMDEYVLFIMAINIFNRIIVEVQMYAANTT